MLYGYGPPLCVNELVNEIVAFFTYMPVGNVAEKNTFSFKKFENVHTVLLTFFYT